jgi:hypothetical protein
MPRRFVQAVARGLEALEPPKKLLVAVSGGDVEITPDMVTIAPVERKTFVRTFQPSVIEPSFGIGRVMYALFEHSFGIRDGDETRGWMRLPPRIAPLKVALLPLMSNNAAKYAAVLATICACGALPDRWCCCCCSVLTRAAAACAQPTTCARAASRSASTTLARPSGAATAASVRAAVSRIFRMLASVLRSLVVCSP